ncbi:hypothetical protein LEP1GSC058_3794 [Leptospira fainei serovar Hurstbridge str. BUT 6]|uniref:Uncharacterized protein n=1 Tax=Leptospira fainei serovar Hurstbridge str. BUT 6 TaxID=1193011 RepID=S3V0T5_9LEPT|nr:hypothetical protein LEP1GSC058_3794 [Leptospira fainei serovar Hurstbridge str. BUT 6]
MLVFRLYFGSMPPLYFEDRRSSATEFRINIADMLNELYFYVR